MKLKKHIYEIITILAAITLIVISFTPAVIPKNIYKPLFISLPYSLWMGILVTLILIVLTYISTRVHKESKRAIQEEVERKKNSKK